MTKDQAERLEFYLLENDPKIYVQTIDEVDYYIVTCLAPWTNIKYNGEWSTLGTAFDARPLGLRWRYE